MVLLPSKGGHGLCTCGAIMEHVRTCLGEELPAETHRALRATQVCSAAAVDDTEAPAINVARCHREDVASQRSLGVLGQGCVLGYEM